MAHKKLTIPKCLCCGKRLTPQFNMDKTSILYFGKQGTDNMLCSYICGVVFTKTIITDPKYNVNDYIRLRFFQLQNCVSACLERDCKKDAERYMQKYNAYLYLHPNREFLKMANIE